MTNVAVRVPTNLFDSLLEARLSAEIRQQLAITKAAHGRSALRYPPFGEGPHLGDESALDLNAHPFVHDTIESVARHRQTEFESLEWGRALALLGRHGDAGFFVNLQSANDATKVMAGSLSRHGIDLA